MNTNLPLEYASPLPLGYALSAKQPPLTPLAKALVMLLCVLLLLFSTLALTPKFTTRSEQARDADALTDVYALGTALDAFKQDVGRYPTTAEGLNALVTSPGAGRWKGPYISKGVPNDPWGYPYLYQCPGKRNPGGYDLSSAGKDGMTGTSDDILNP